MNAESLKVIDVDCITYHFIEGLEGLEGELRQDVQIIHMGKKKSRFEKVKF